MEAGGLQVLGVFAKQPIAGQVKTRLCPPCSPQQAADLYRVSLLETVERFLALDRPLVLFYAGERAWFAEQMPGVELRPQGDGDLGRRMSRTLDTLLAEGFSAAALVGSDSPDLPTSLVDEAFAALATEDAVVAPAEDGGYVLVGCRRPCPELFSGIDWSTDAVLTQTRRAASAAGIRLAEVRGWEDLDDGSSLQRLLQRSPDTRTARFLAEKLGDLFPS